MVGKRQAASSQLKADKCQSRRKNRYGFARMSFGNVPESPKGAKTNSGSKRKRSWRKELLRTKNRQRFLNNSRAPVLLVRVWFERQVRLRQRFTSPGVL